MIMARFLQQHAVDAVECVLLELDTQCHYSLGIDTQLLADSAGPSFASMLLCAPLLLLPLADEACLLVQQQLLKISSSRTLMALKPHVHARITHLPRTPEIIRETVSSILSRDIGHVLQVL
jgi:DNA helicase MCM9